MNVYVLNVKKVMDDDDLFFAYHYYLYGYRKTKCGKFNQNFQVLMAANTKMIDSLLGYSVA
jgi:hypothetical protein